MTKILTLAVLVFYIGLTTAECPYILADNVPCYELSPGRCYCISFTKVNWVEATVQCRTNAAAITARLLSIEDAAEEALVVNHIKNTPGLSLADSFWTSGSDSQLDGAWFWTSTGDLVSYKNWVEGFVNSDTEDCMLISRTENYYWDDAACSSLANFICEGTPTSSESTTTTAVTEELTTTTTVTAELTTTTTEEPTTTIP